MERIGEVKVGRNRLEKKWEEIKGKKKKALEESERGKAWRGKKTGGIGSVKRIRKK